MPKYSLETPRVLVLLAARNGERSIERQLGTVLAQQGVDLQVHVRDDASSDNTRDIVARLSRADRRLHLRPDHCSTGSAAANFFELIRSSDVASFNLVAFCDQDDEWHVDKLARAVDRMHASRADGYSAAVEARWQNGRRKTMRQVTEPRSADYLFEGGGQGCTFVMSAKLFQLVQDTLREQPALIEKLHYHDWTVYALARTRGLAWFIDQQVTMVYHQHGGNDTGARNSASGVLRRLSLIREGWYRGQVMAITQLVQAVNSADPQAAKWLALSLRHPSSWLDRCRKFAFVTAHGRRRLLDRCILLGAVALNYL